MIPSIIFFIKNEVNSVKEFKKVIILKFSHFLPMIYCLQFFDYLTQGQAREVEK